MQWAEVMRSGIPELALLFAVPNGARTSMSTARKLKAEGLKAGIPDVMLPVARGGFNGLFVELKRRKGGKASAEQLAWLEALRKQGYYAVICHGWNDAAWNIQRYLLGDYGGAQCQRS